MDNELFIFSIIYTHNNWVSVDNPKSKSKTKSGLSTSRYKVNDDINDVFIS